MPPHVVISCNECEFRQDFITRLQREYELDDGSRITVNSRTAFCADCQKVVDAERLPDPDSIHQRIIGIRDGAEDEDIKYIERSREEWAAYHERVLRWRSSRNTPPHCLECGSLEIHALEEPWDSAANDTHDVTCPKCRAGILSLGVHGIVRMIEDSTLVYGSEGNLLRKEDESSCA